MTADTSAPELRITHPSEDPRLVPLYRTTVTVGGESARCGRRNHRARSVDGDLDVVLALPREMGGSAGATNPEQLLAAGYAASFHQALSLLAQQDHVEASRLRVEATISVGTEPSYGGHVLTAELTVHWPGVGRRVAKALIARAKQRDPCSKMMRRGLLSTTRLAEIAR